jgi:hypothetical protein
VAQLHDRYIYDDDDTDAAFKILTFGNICFVRSRKTSISVGVVCERERERKRAVLVYSARRSKYKH